MDRKNENWTIIRALQHVRHDWMNHIQLIKGYIALGKTEEAERTIEQIVMQAKQEAHLCSLPLPELVKLLVTFNWDQHSFQLEYEVLDKNIRTETNDEQLVSLMISLFDLMERWIEKYADNQLYLSIEGTNDGLRFFFEFSGIITNTEAFIRELTGALNTAHVKRGQIHSHSLEECSFEVIV
ncbi:Spo0B C-terminal domain-containing protein [Bacillus sp. B190/17]|uniref:Spo0B C-terminal domain-containing protein n=1 Tax=Bacillus lumedeiriae TaxID=3058829 RepID=A0ABW8I4U5_9BACI